VYQGVAVYEFCSKAKSSVRDAGLQAWWLSQNPATKSSRLWIKPFGQRL
jgi:hypothetical protein